MYNLKAYKKIKVLLIQILEIRALFIKFHTCQNNQANIKNDLKKNKNKILRLINKNLLKVILLKYSKMTTT